MTGDYNEGQSILGDGHCAMLEQESNIKPEVIAARGYYTANHPDQLVALGFSKAHAKRMIPALVIPQHAHDGTVTYLVRPNRREADADAPKYFSPKGQQPILDCNPLALVDLNDLAVDLWFTEGSKKADSAISHGLCTLSISGVYSWRTKAGPLADWEYISLKSRNVFLAFDSDVMHKPAVWCALRRLVNFLRGRGAIVSIVYLPDLADGKKCGLDDYFVSGGTVKELYELAEPELRPLRDGTAIETNSRQLRNLLDDALAALIAANDPPTLFVCNGKLVRVTTDERKQASIEEYHVASMRHRLAQVADWISTSDKRGSADVQPPQTVCETLLAAGTWEGIPSLRGIITAPAFASNGMLHSAEGYNEDTELYLHAPPADIGDTSPIPGNIDRAKNLLFDDLLIDFRFAEQSSATHSVAFLLLPFVRDFIDGPTPLHLFEAPVAGSGKSLLCETLGSVFAGTVFLNPPPKQNEEWEKVITSVLISGASHLIFDNARRLDSEALFGALTNTMYSSRLLGGNQMARLPVRVTWAATANNLQAGEELLRRSVLVRLDTGTERPEERSGFKHEDLRTYAKTHRGPLVGACLTLVRNWLQQGRPDYAGNGRMGSYEGYVRVIGGILHANGIPGFLSNREALRERSDTDTEAWCGFVEAWYSAHGEKPVTAANLFDLALTWLPDKLGDGSDRSQRTRLGKMLSAHVDRIFSGKKIESAGKVTSGDNKNAAQFRLCILPDTSGERGNVGNVGTTDVREYSKSNSDMQYTPYNRGRERSQRSHVPPTLEATASQLALAKSIGETRKSRLDGKRSQQSERGSDSRNATADRNGAHAEVVTVQFLEATGLPVTDWKPLEPKPVPRPDIYVGPIPVEIKAVSPGSLYFCINEAQRKKFATIPGLLYLPVLLHDERTLTLCCTIPAAEVEQWELVTPEDNPKIHAPCRSIAVSRLKPLTDLDALRPQEGEDNDATGSVWE